MLSWWQGQAEATEKADADCSRFHGCRLVYELYGLTEEEIRIVEGSAPG